MSSNNFHALRGPDGKWAVRRAGAGRALHGGLTRRSAWAEARRLARGADGTAFLHGRDGRIELRQPYLPPAVGREKSAAVLSVFDAAGMTPRGRGEIAAWLRRHAAMLVKEGKNYTRGRFTGRYLYA